MLTLTLSNATTAALFGQLPICQAGNGNPWGDLAFWKVLAGITAVLATVWLVLQIANSMRRKPGLDKELGLLATKQELAEMEARITKRGEDRERTLSSEMAEMRRALTAQTSNLNHRMEAATTADGIKMEAIQRQLGEIIGELRARRPSGPAK